MTKKVLALMTAGIMAAVSITGCGGSSAPASTTAAAPAETTSAGPAGPSADTNSGSDNIATVEAVPGM